MRHLFSPRNDTKNIFEFMIKTISHRLKYFLSANSIIFKYIIMLLWNYLKISHIFQGIYAFLFEYYE